MPRSALALLIAALILMPGTVLAQDNCTGEDCGDCTACRNNNFYYILVSAIIIFLVFFWMRNRKPVMKKPVEQDAPEQREG
ncbi:MAG: hypothetical protein R6W91_05105 [Thermoplasmata archaeon]